MFYKFIHYCIILTIIIITIETNFSVLRIFCMNNISDKFSFNWFYYNYKLDYNYS